MAWRYVILIILGLSIFLTAYVPSQNEFTWILCFYSLAFGCYALVLARIDEFDAKILLGLFLTISASLLFTFPLLSDDIYRYYWDASLLSKSISPYAYLPSELLNENVLDAADIEIYPLLNSSNYYSIYPPLNQVFYLAAYSLSSSIISFSICLKAIYLIIIMLGWNATFRLCQLIGRDPKYSYIFFLNPLVLVEGIGNLHIELAMVSLLAIAFYVYKKSGHAGIFASLYAGAIGLKLNPLIISPFFWFHQEKRWKITTTILTILFSILLLSPIIWWSGQSGFLSSVDLYFRKFEFNGSIYYLARFLGRIYSGYNMIAQIGPILAFVVLISILRRAYKNKERDIFSILKHSLWAWTLYLICSTTIHPWYTIPLVYFAVFVDRKYPILWSYLITWTYINYSYTPYYENLWVVTGEYLILGFVIIYEADQYAVIKNKMLKLIRVFKP